MKTIITYTIVGLSMLGVTQAEERKRGHRGHGGERLHKHFLEKYDKDGDGKLSEEEKVAAKEEWKKRHVHMKELMGEVKENLHEKYDTDNDGELSEEEKKAIKETAKQQWEIKKEGILKLYDANGDGELDEDERKEARDAWKDEFLLKHDKDGDGELSDEEKKAAIEGMVEDNPEAFVMRHMMHRRGKRGKCGEGDCKKEKSSGDDSEVSE